jgi:putative hydrolase of the HAD superfamily
VIEAVLFDLDDTLFVQAEFLAGAWVTVAEAAAAWSVDPGALTAALAATAAEGSDRGRIIDRSLAAIGRTDVPVEPLVRAFRAHRPTALSPLPGVLVGLQAVRRHVPVALVTDGDPQVQVAKLDALALSDAFDEIVLSDTLGRARRKPHPAPFLAAAGRLGVAPNGCVMVGDRPDKDTVGARNAGLLGAVRVRTGEHQSQEDGPGCLASVPDVDAAFRWLARRLDPAAANAPAANAPTATRA